jgi:tetratricopeptide (TPR) repeat protein
MRVRSGLVAASLGAVLFVAQAGAGETPKYGGTLTYMIPADAPPSLDGHRETTYATVHSAAPFYSVLIRINPENPSSTTDFVCDLCTAMPQPTDDGKTYTFKIRDGVKFHDGSPLTSADVAASWNAIIHPPEGVSSARESYYIMVDNVEAPDPATVVFHLKFATGAFLPALGDPYAWIYKKEILDKDPRWYEKNVMGSGPFTFAEYQLRQSIKGVRNPDYYHQGLPYLDGFTGIYADKQAVRVDAIRADRAAMEFRGLPPSARDQLVKELGDKIAVQESDWNCGNLVTPNASSSSSLAHFATAQVLRAQRRYAQAIPEYQTAIALNRNFAAAFFALGLSKLYAGSIEETIPLEEQAIRLSPRDPQIGICYQQIGRVHLLESRTEEAILWFEKARSANPALPFMRAELSSAYALKGDTERASAELAEARRLSADDRYTSIARLRAAGSWGSAERPRLMGGHILRRSAQGRDAGGMTTIRRLAAILAAMSRAIPE